MKPHTKEQLENANKRIIDAVNDAEKTATIPHIGKDNSKTNAVNEGTSPIVCCTKNAPCRFYCYAIWHIDNIYKQARKNHAENTILRRRNALAYYEHFFQYAEKKNKLLRLNETGDFENINQIKACAEVAARHPTVTALAYTRRYAACNVKLPSNLRIMISLFDKGNDCGNNKVVLPVTMVRENKTTCPAQIRAAKIKAGAKLPPWHCADCAKAKIGCFGKNFVIFKTH